MLPGLSSQPYLISLKNSHSHATQQPHTRLQVNFPIFLSDVKFNLNRCHGDEDLCEGERFFSRCTKAGRGNVTDLRQRILKMEALCPKHQNI